MIKESRRSPLTSKILKFDHSDDSDRGTGNFSSQHQPKSHKVLDHVDTLQNVQSKRETQLQVVPRLSKVRERNKTTHIGKILVCFIPYMPFEKKN